MSTSESSSSTQQIPVGIDIGSLNARIAIVSKTDTNADIAVLAGLPPSPDASIIPNELGLRHTLALATPEPKVEADPLNDQYWDNPKKKKTDATEEPTRYIHGDAARRTLHRLKKPLKPHFILNQINEVIAMLGNNDEGNIDSNENGTDADADATNDGPSRLEACEAFFAHLTAQASNATGSSTHPSSLRYVLAVPPESTDQLNATTRDALIQTVESGNLRSCEEIGWDSAPALLQSANLNKRDKKQVIQTLKETNRVIGVITHPMAIGHAHNLFDSNCKRPEWKNALIVDWGASALTLTHLVKLGSTETVSILNTKSQKTLNGQNILSMLVSHVAELFERSSRGMVPRGETLLNKKAKMKLEVECEDSIRSLGYSPKVHVTIDGLFEGIDCHVEVMLARFEMLIGGILRSADQMIRAFMAENKVAYDVVIGAGGVLRMKCVEQMMNRLFAMNGSSPWKGESASDVPPEEAVAIGSAKFGHILLSSCSVLGLDNGVVGANKVVEEDVALTPIGIGLSLQEGDPAAVVMIEANTPLPAVKTVNVTASSDYIGVVQTASASSSENSDKLIGKINNSDGTPFGEIELHMELSVDGQLKVSVNGGPTLVL